MKQALFFVLLVIASCASTPKEGGAGFPPRPKGCEITVYAEAPTVQTSNIGPVSATCDASVSDDDCLRTLKDEACKLGGDVVWGVEAPVKDLGKKKYVGRAAHTGAAPAPTAK